MGKHGAGFRPVTRHTKRGAGNTRYKAVQEAYKRDKARVSQQLNPFTSYIDSNDMAVAYLDKSSGNIVVGIRGTKDARDWLRANTLIPLNRLHYSPQYQEAKQLVQELRQKYPNAKIELAGHSLGGAIASQLKRELGNDVVATTEVWNPATQPVDLFDGKATNTIRHHHEYDPLRWLPFSYGKAIETDVKLGPEYGLPAHSMEVFEGGAALQRRMRGAGHIRTPDGRMIWVPDGMEQQLAARNYGTRDAATSAAARDKAFNQSGYAQQQMQALEAAKAKEKAEHPFGRPQNDFDKWGDSFLRGYSGAADWVADKIDAAAPALSGPGGTALKTGSDLYKTFATPYSKFYNNKSLAEKAKEFGEQTFKRNVPGASVLMGSGHCGRGCRCSYCR